MNVLWEGSCPHCTFNVSVKWTQRANPIHVFAYRELINASAQTNKIWPAGYGRMCEMCDSKQMHLAELHCIIYMSQQTKA